MSATLRQYCRTFEVGVWDSRLCSMYGASLVQDQKKRYLTFLRDSVSSLGEDKVLLLNSCGRAELGGNHTDHNHGNVLAAGVHLDILAAVCAKQNMTVTLLSENFPKIMVDLNNLEKRDHEFGTPQAIIRGVAAGLREKGYEICGFSACITSSIPIGSGLSSSAAFEVLVCNIFNHLVNNQKISKLDMARLSRDVENTYFGKPCGFMDQIACAFNGILQIDFATPDNPEIKPVSFDFEEYGYQLAIVETGGDHANLTGDYAAIPREMSAAAGCLGQGFARGLTLENFFAQSVTIRQQVGDRAWLRLYHFIRENIRAVDQAQALKQKEVERFLQLVRESGDSSFKYLQNCTRPQAIDNQPIPVALAMSESFLGEKGAVRVHGGGFAGTIQVFVPRDLFIKYRDFMNSCFGEGAVIPLHVRQPGNESFEIK